MPSHAPRWRKGSVFGCAFRPLDRNDLARILFLAEALDRRTHQPGKHGGIIGRSGLAVLRALICRFFNKASGRLDPSIAAIAAAANVAKSTAQEALNRLELVGLIERVRRIARVRSIELCPITERPAERVRVVQITNGYLLNVPIPNRREDGDLSRRPPRASNTGKREGTTHIFNSKSLPAVQPLNEGLAAALERLGEAIKGRSVPA